MDHSIPLLIDYSLTASEEVFQWTTVKLKSTEFTEMTPLPSLITEQDLFHFCGTLTMPPMTSQSHQ